MIQQATGLRPPLAYTVVGEDKKITVNWKNYFDQLWLFFSYAYQGNVPVMPRYTTAGITGIDNPQTGMIVYNSDLNKFQGYTNGSWITFTTS